MDATQPIRDMLDRSCVHTYDGQVQGSEGKVMVPTMLAGELDSDQNVIHTRTSLYRPETKDGDPRMWIYSLAKAAKGGDFLGLAVDDEGRILAVNLSQNTSKQISGWLSDLGFPSPSVVISNLPLARLIQALETAISAGPLKAVGTGSTAVGRTLELALGIEMNSSRLPDWEDTIELKTSRPRPSQRKPLFAKVPDWKKSVLSSNREILEKFGYIDAGGILSLNVTVRNKPNKQGLFLKISDDGKYVEERSNRSDIPLVAVWSMDEICATLAKKHAETCWINCEEETIGDELYFLPNRLAYTRGPRVDLVPLLIQSGDLSLDHGLRLRGSKLTDHGTLWKVSVKAHGQLLPLVTDYELKPRR